MIRGELKKIWKSRALRLFLVAFFVINIVQINRGIPRENPKSFVEGEQMIYAKVRGAWTDEKLRFVTENAQRTEAIRASGDYSTEPDQPGTYTGYIFGDCMVFAEIYDEMSYMYHYGQNMQAVLDRAAENAVFYGERGNAVLRRENEQIMRLYQNRSIPAYYRTDGAEQLISYDFSALLTVFAVLLCTVPVFAREHSARMQELLLTAPNGGAALTLAKTAAAMLSVSAISIAFSLCDAVCFAWLYRIDCFSLPLYAVGSFRNTPFSGTVLQYLLLLALCRLLGAWFLTVICLLCSVLLRTENAAFALSAVTVFGIMRAGGTWNPMLLFCFRTVSKRYAADHVRTLPVLHSISLICMTAAIIILLTALLIIVRRGRQT